MRRNYYWCKTFMQVWIIKCYTDEEAKIYSKRCYLNMKLIG